ncbi:hypothetical protein PAPYR_6060 [Paratrimastix pyriformis]|uniref:Phospholipid/glycerol acyltransferase domain-containing protein n=1 Tax=Paratrimastix pyriformis TaxID=342808 RepID=A0ABQ8UII0_9EUKA|nr:hypothetical protein PAPYR_6060 [Paratrimastix pyriformis]
MVNRKALEKRCSTVPAFKPFIHTEPAPFGLWEFIKSVFLLPLAPIRVAGAFLSFVVYYLLCRLAFVGYPVKNFDRPHPRWRRFLSQVFIAIQGRLIMGFMGFIRVRVTGEKPMWNDPHICVCNHSSFLDPVVLGAVFGAPGFPGKSGLRDMPILGFLMCCWRCIFIQRSQERMHAGGASSAANDKKNDQEASPNAPVTSASSMANNTSPEAEAKSANSPPAVQIDQPVGGTTALELIGRRQQRAENDYSKIEVQPLYHPSPEEQADPQLYADNVGHLMAEKLHVPYVEQGLSEKLVLHRCLAGRLTFEAAMTESLGLCGTFYILLPAFAHYELTCDKNAENGEVNRCTNTRKKERMGKGYRTSGRIAQKQSQRPYYISQAHRDDPEIEVVESRPNTNGRRREFQATGQPGEFDRSDMISAGPCSSAVQDDLSMPFRDCAPYEKREPGNAYLPGISDFYQIPRWPDESALQNPPPPAGDALDLEDPAPLVMVSVEKVLGMPPPAGMRCWRDKYGRQLCSTRMKDTRPE